jgi:hypothetical protein
MGQPPSGRRSEPADVATHRQKINQAQRRVTVHMVRFSRLVHLTYSIKLLAGEARRALPGERAKFIERFRTLLP